MWPFRKRRSPPITHPTVRLVADKAKAEGASAQPLPPPATEHQVASTEAALGVKLPPLLRSCFLEFANGGFGPGLGLMGAKGGFRDDLGHDIAAAYASYLKEDPHDTTWRWPKSWIPVLHWGCAIYSCIDCGTTDYRMCVFDPNHESETEGWATCFFREPCSFDTWLQDWLAGVDLWERLHHAERLP